jgi:short-subunit dehydrogenase
MQVRGAVVLVTGASSGIGRATALRLAEAGALVVAHGRDVARLAEVAGRTGGVALAEDLAEPAAGRRLAERAVQAAGRVDIVVGNAGAGWAGRLADMPAPAPAALIAANLTAHIELTRALLPAMLARGAGHLMYVTSIAGRTGVAGEAVYAATKAGLDTFAESLRLELHGTGVEVGVLVPGVVRTAFFDRRGQPYHRRWPRPLPAEQVAGTLVRAIATGRAERYAPRWLRLPVAVRSVLPGAYRRLAVRFGGT